MRGLTMVGISAATLTGALMLISFAEAVMTDPGSLYLLVVILLLILSTILVVATYPKPSPYEVAPFREVPRSWEDLGEGAGTGSNEIGDQLTAYLELKKLMIERAKNRRDIGKEEWNTIAKDDSALYKILEDEDLLRLVVFDGRARKIQGTYFAEGLVFGTGFPRRFDYLLGKVEAWK